ncbi:MAG: hypothetical protein ACUVS2_00160 [Candidatus Flexifilum sp.]
MSPDNTPDFNSMSPEEIMAWLETLARKQGATEGFTTAANLDIPDIDPASVVIDEPGYVPYHEQSTTVQSVISPAAAPPAAPPPPRSLPVEPPPPVEADVMRTAPSPSMNAAASNSALAWLESLAADQGDALFNLDLTDDDAAPTPATDPVSWLEDLARAQGELGPLAPPSDVDQAPAAVEDEAQLDLNWLETIAARQGARPEELITAHNAVVPPVPPAKAEEPAYTPFSFERSQRPTPAAEAPTSDPSSWLQSMAAEQGYDEAGVKTARPEPPPPPPADDLSEAAINAAIAKGTVTPEQMKVWLEIQAERASQQPEIPSLEEEDEDTPPIRAEIPDWLIEQVGAPPVDDLASSGEDRPAFESLFPAAAVDAKAEAEPKIPDWLREEVGPEQPLSMDSVFVSEQEEADEPAPASIEVDPADPWVEAFDLEHELGEIDIHNVPDWYTANLADPERIARVEELAGGSAAPEAEVETESGPLLPARFKDEDVLPPGEAQPLPDWLVAALPLTTPEPAAAAFIPDEQPEAEPIPPWLRDIEAEINPEDIPPWLKQSIEESISPPEPVVESMPPVVPAVQPVAAAAPAAPPSAPRPQPAAFTIAASLETARARSKEGDLESSLHEYEALIRANVQIDDIVDDLTSLAKLHRGHPVVYRVLGDGLMRQGKLQEALDTYREALSQL